MARVREAINETEMLPIQAKNLKALIAAICYGQNRRFPTGVHNDAMGTSKLPGFLASATSNGKIERGGMSISHDTAHQES
jgi:hypothetical protein